MVAFILLFGLVVFSVTEKCTTFADRSPIRSQDAPSVVTPYQNGRTRCTDNDDDIAVEDEKTYLERCQIAKSNTSQLEENAPIDEKLVNRNDFLLSNNKNKLSNLWLRKKKIIDMTKEVLLKSLKEIEKKKYLLEVRLDLFLQNLIDAIFNRNQKFAASMDNIKTLILSNYFQPDRKILPINDNTRSIAGDLNRRANGDFNEETRTNQLAFAPAEYNLYALLRDYNREKYLQTLTKSNAIRYLTMVACWLKSNNLEKLINNANNLNENFKTRHLYKFNDRDKYLNNIAVIKKYTDTNEPAITESSFKNDQRQINFNDYNEKGENIASVTSKRYLGALARSGWLPRSFTLRSPGSYTFQEYENRKPIGAFDRLRSLRTIHIRDKPTYYTYYREGPGRSPFRGQLSFAKRY